MKPHFAYCLFVFALALMSACAPAPAATPLPTGTQMSTATATSTPAPTLTATAAPTSTATPQPTATRTQTSTPTPTETPQPQWATLHTYGGDFNFDPKVMPPTYQNALRENPMIANLKNGAGVLKYYEVNLRQGQKSYDIFIDPKSTLNPDASSITRSAYFLKVKKAEYTGQLNGKYRVIRVQIDLGDNTNASILLQTSQSVLSNFPYPWAWSYYVVPGATIDPGMIRPGDEIAYSLPGHDDFPPLIAEKVNAAVPGKPVELGLFGYPDAQILLNPQP